MLPVLDSSGRRLLLSGKSKSVGLYLQESELVLRRGSSCCEQGASLYTKQLVYSGWSTP